MWATFLNHINATITSIGDTAVLFWQGLLAQISLLAIIDILLVFILLWWIYKKLRRTDLIKILPKIFLLLLIMLVARILGLVTLFYVSGAITLLVLLSLAALYASEIKNVLESQVLILGDTRLVRTSTGDVQGVIRSLGEAFAVLTKAQKSALVVIKQGRSLMRLVENGTKMNSKVKSELIIDFFANGSTLSKGAVVIEGDRIVAAGSTLFKRDSRVLFNVTNPVIRKVAKDLDAVVVVANRTMGSIAVLHGDDIYRNLSPQDLTRVLRTILFG